MKALKIIGGLLLVIGIIVVLSVILHRKHEESERQKDKIESLKKAQVVQLPDRYTEPYTLKKGKVIRVNIPSGYTSSCSSGGKKYYKQPQNGKKEVRGDGGNYRDKYVAYFDLSFYEEEIEVVVEFKKQ